MHQVAEHQRAFSGFGLDTHNGMFGLIDRPSEHLVKMFFVGLAVGHDGEEGIAVNRPEFVGEPLQRRRNVQIGGHSV